MLFGFLAVIMGSAVAIWINDYTPWGGPEFPDDVENV
jgi:hypothetical protein